MLRYMLQELARRTRGMWPAVAKWDETQGSEVSQENWRNSKTTPLDSPSASRAKASSWQGGGFWHSFFASDRWRWVFTIIEYTFAHCSGSTSKCIFEVGHVRQQYYLLSGPLNDRREVAVRCASAACSVERGTGRNWIGARNNESLCQDNERFSTCVKPRSKVSHACVPFSLPEATFRMVCGNDELAKFVAGTVQGCDAIKCRHGRPRWIKTRHIY